VTLINQQVSYENGKSIRTKTILSLASVRFPLQLISFWIFRHIASISTSKDSLYCHRATVMLFEGDTTVIWRPL